MRFISRIRLSIILLLVGLCQQAVAQQNTIYRFKAEGDYGWILNHDGNYYGGELALELPLLGNHNWEYTYNFPTVGFAAGYHHLNDPKYMRHTVELYPYFHYPIVHTNAFALNLRWGGGLVGQIKDKGTDYYYFPLTGVFVGGVNMEFALSTRYGRPAAQWMINIGANFRAMHNGNVTRKARNTNMADVELGLKYTPNVWPLPIKHPAKSVKHTLALEIYGAAGANQLDVDDKFYPNGTLNIGVFIPISNAYRLGIAADGFYNGVYDGTQREHNQRYNFIKEDKFINKVRVGVALANEITTDRVNVGLHVGFYCLDKIKVPKYNENGTENKNRIENLLYTKLVARYYITPKFFAVFEVKSHLLKVENLGLGLGWAMPEFGSRLKNPFARISFKKEDKEELRITGSER